MLSIATHPATQKERREREKAEVSTLPGLRRAVRPEEGADLSRAWCIRFIYRYMARGYEKILLASMLTIWRFLQERERLAKRMQLKEPAMSRNPLLISGQR